MLRNQYVEAFHQLTTEANDAGLMRRRYGFYWTMMLFWTLVTAAILVGVHLPAGTQVPRLKHGGRPPMRITINPTTCIASGNCSRMAPRVFANRDEDDGFVSVIDENPPEAEWASVREAEDLCPSATIRIEEDGAEEVSGSA